MASNDCGEAGHAEGRCGNASCAPSAGVAPTELTDEQIAEVARTALGYDGGFQTVHSGDLRYFARAVLAATRAEPAPTGPALERSKYEPKSWDLIRAAEDVGVEGLTEPYLSDGDRQITDLGKAFINGVRNVLNRYTRAARAEPAGGRPDDTDKLLAQADAVIADAEVAIDAAHRFAAAAGGRDEREDAERYRWLKEKQIDWLPPHYNGVPRGRFDMSWYCDERDLDAAIDAARASRATQQPPTAKESGHG
jgi:hypothetical protein